MTTSFDPAEIRRPDPRLRNYYLLLGLFSGFVTTIPFLAKYFTLQYQFDDSGVSMKWGILFRHEIHLTYRRIQDIHLTRNLLQRWLGLATVSVQTASGSSAPEMKIEGILAAEELRDYLYSQMRGAKGLATDANATPNTPATAAEVTQLLSDIRDALQRIAAGESPQPPAAATVTEIAIEATPATTIDSDPSTPADMVPSRDVDVAASDGAVELASEAKPETVVNEKSSLESVESVERDSVEPRESSHGS